MNSETLIIQESRTPIQASISWRAALAGLLVSLLTFAGLGALSLALGGIGLSDGSEIENAGIFTGVSLIVSVVLSVFAGSYFAVRSRGNRANRSPYSEAILVAALMIFLVVMQAGRLVGGAGKTVGAVLGFGATTVGAGAFAMGESPMLRNIVEDNLGQLNLKSSPETVLRGVTTRLVNGNEEGAKNYLAWQSGLTRAEAEQKIAAAKAKIDEAMVATREATADAMRTTGWAFLGTIVFALLASLLGARLAIVAEPPLASNVVRGPALKKVL